MTRQCAWCDCYLDCYPEVVQSETDITHGICERCAERVLNSSHQISPLLEDLVLAAPIQSSFVDSELKHVA